uniref:Large ribosomal subunit protein uL3c n=1 Tax=Spumella sp. Baekdong012001B8 TaxID=2782410 RepID=A0A7S6TCN2_9STRA|nr:ribosomal protein L3 [Spumella sp. Baekdong012001B8]
MSITILGNKVGMSQAFDSKGNAIPVTIIKTSPCYITQLKTKENCGYHAIQIGYMDASITKQKVSRPMHGHFAKANLPAFCHVKEFKVSSTLAYSIGQKFSLEDFKVGQLIEVRGVTIGKGNAGNIKRNAFSRGPMSHGSKHHRLQGSIGAGTSPGRVIPGKKMPGRMGGDNQTIKGLKVVYVNVDANIIAIKGSVPGKCQNLLRIKCNLEQ